MSPASAVLVDVELPLPVAAPVASGFAVAGVKFAGATPTIERRGVKIALCCDAVVFRPCATFFDASLNIELLMIEPASIIPSSNIW